MSRNLFNTVALDKPKKNVFDLSHDVKLSLNIGQLVPICVMDCVPGDKFNIGCESLLRFAPLVSPVMHRMDVSMHYFFVPNRILWDHWEQFITQTKVAGSVPVAPYGTLYGGNDAGYTDLMDYMGLPRPSTCHQTGAVTEHYSSLPFAAYQKIYNDYYRDENLVPEVPYKQVDGYNANVGDWGQLQKRAWEHDYFTASLPFAQKGSPVSLPLGEVMLDPTLGNYQPGVMRVPSDHSMPPINAPLKLSNGGTDANLVVDPGGTQTPIVYDPMGTLINEPTTINDLRRAFRLQEWLEKNARGGTRYIENILAHFGVRSSDKRLQRAEYITGTKSPVVISEILNTTGTSTLPQGNMAGHGISVTAGKYGSYFCEEHGWIIGIMSVMPKTAYFQGIPRMFSRNTDAFDYYWPEFANIGEQEVLQKEIMAFQGAAGVSSGDTTFGYVPRYAEYKYIPSRVCGNFRNSLLFWHMARNFSSTPTLNKIFVECVDDNRIFAVTGADTQHLYAHVLNKIRAVRPMPFFGNPQF